MATMEKYHEMYAESVNQPAKFWGKIAEEFYWNEKPSEEKFLQYNFNVNDGPISIKWMEDAKTNLCYNCLDRHLPAKKTDVRTGRRGLQTVDTGLVGSVRSLLCHLLMTEIRQLKLF